MSVHIHTTITRKTDQTLEELTKTYGTKSHVIEQAVETLLRVEKVGSCDDCAVRAKAREQTNLREALDLMSIDKHTIDSLLDVAIGNKTMQNFVAEQKAEAKNTVEILKGSVAWGKPSSFKEFMMIMEEIKNLTRLIDIASYNELDNTIILRTRAFKQLPEIAAFQLTTVLEGLQIPFDMRVMGEDIVVKMVRDDLYLIKKKDFRESLSEQIGNRLLNSTPGLFRNTLMLVGPAFMKWAEKHLEEPISDFGSFLEDVRVALGSEELPKEPKEFVKKLLSAFINMNWFKQAKILQETKNAMEISFQSTTSSATKLSVVMLSVILANRGWKLVRFSAEQTAANMSIQYVGSGDSSLMDQIVEVSLYETIGKQFLDTIPVPRELFNSFASRVYDSNKEKFDEIYHIMGVRLANAIRMMARDDTERMKKLAQTYISKNATFVQPEAEIRFVDAEHFTIIFKKIEPLAMNSQRSLIESMFKELGYEISTTIFQNLLSFRLKQLEKPVLESIPRKKMMKALIDEMSASCADEAFEMTKGLIEETFPEDYPWTIREVGDRITEMYREVDVEVEVEYFEGGFTLKYKTCPYYTLVKSGQKTWLCSLRKKTLDYIISRVSHGKKAKIKIIKTLLKNEHPCEYAIFLTGFLEES
jgi:antitoxin component of RelBE/YafQ-DinJ toxin-antitoxin module